MKSFSKFEGLVESNSENNTHLKSTKPNLVRLGKKYNHYISESKEELIEFSLKKTALSFKKYLLKTFKRLKAFVKKAVKSISSWGKKAKFGSELTVQLNKRDITTVVTEDKQEVASKMALFGYLAEYSCVYELCRIIDSEGLQVGLTSSTSLTSIEATGKTASEVAKKRLDEFTKLNGLKGSDYKRNVDAGIAQAKEIYKDSIVGMTDLTFMEFVVSHTGDLLKGESVADARLMVRKKDSGEVVNDILASLKSYKGWNVNLANNTINSFFGPENTNLAQYIDDDIMNALVDDSKIRTTLTNIMKDFKTGKITQSQAKSDIVSKFGEPAWAPVTYEFLDSDGIDWLKEKGQRIDMWKAAVKSSYDTYSDVLRNRFRDAIMSAYEKAPEETNQNILRMLGMDGSDEFYLAVSTAKGIKVVSSKTSKEYKSLIDKMQKGFKLEFKFKDTDRSQFQVEFNMPDGTTLLKGNVTFSTTGSLGTAKTNFFVDFGGLK